MENTKNKYKFILTSVFLLVMAVFAFTMPVTANAQYYGCTYHAYRLCVGNSNIYWYDSCSTQQDLYLSCNNGQVCNNQSQYGQCATYTTILSPDSNPNNYNPYATKSCYGNNLYWYDSLGVQSGLYKNCADNNSCTVDSCSGDKCSNTTKCDGSTCSIGSADYNTYCLSTKPNQCGNGLCDATLGETNIVCPSDCKLNEIANGLSTVFFSKQDSSSSQWGKTAQANSGGQIYFMISATNNSNVQIDNVNISANIPNEISSLGNLQLNNVPVTGDIVTGINIGSVAPLITKIITFEGKIQTIPESPGGYPTKQATATSTVSGVNQTDSVSINFTSVQQSPDGSTAAVSEPPEVSKFNEWLKQWYLWILAGLVLVFLFIVVFKRFSSDV